MRVLAIWRSRGASAAAPLPIIIFSKKDPKWVLYGEGRVGAKARLLEAIAYYFSQEGKDVFSSTELADQIETYLQQNPQETVWQNTNSDQLICELCEEVIRNWTINIYEMDIFLLARKLAVRYNQENLPFIPVYSHLVRFSY